MQFSHSKSFSKGVAFLCPLSLSIPASHWKCGRNIYSSPVLLLGAKMDTWHKCLDVSFRPLPKLQTKPPTQSIQTKVRTPSPLPNYTLRLWNSGISDVHPRTWPLHAAVLMVAAVFPPEMYSRRGGTVFGPWTGHENSLCTHIIFALSRTGAPYIRSVRQWRRNAGSAEMDGSLTTRLQV